MRVLILSPTAFPSVTGNGVTTERWRRHLGQQGVEARVQAVQSIEAEDLREALRVYRPDVIHVHHAYKAGRVLCKGKALAGAAPVVLSPAGTDLDLDADTNERRSIIEKMVGLAKFLIVQSREMEAMVLERLAHAGRKLVRVPKACAWLGDQPYDLREMAGAGPEELIFFLPAGIRPVKGNLEWVKAMEQLHRLRPNIRAILAGPILDPSYGRRLLKELESLQNFARWIGTIPPGAMKAAYKGADVVVNSSFSEGLSNALMEAVSQARPILATDIPGNRWPVVGSGELDPSGILYDPHDPDDMLEKALMLADDRELRQRLSLAGLARSSELGNPMEEARQLARVYREALDGRD